MTIKDYQGFTQEKFLSIKKILDRSPMLKFLAIEVEFLSPGFSRVRIPFRPDFLQGFGVVQGGIIATAGDTAAGIAFLTLIAPNETLVTIDLKINFLVPVKHGDIFSECKIIQKGSFISVGEFEVKSFEEILVAKGMSTLTSRRRREGEFENNLPNGNFLV